MTLGKYTRFILKNLFKNKYRFKNLTIKNSLKTNWFSWIAIIIMIFIISYKNITNGYFTFVFFIFLSYFYHVYIHKEINIATIIHHYHHENDNLFSHLIQLILELSIPYPYMLLNYFFNINIFNTWIIVFFILFYSSIHNINYGFFKINNVHKIHHKKIYYNFGPDICDVTFGTKHKSENNVENTNHYVPNVIVCGLIVLYIKYLYTNNNNNNNNNNIYKLTLIGSSFMYIFLIITSIYLWIFKKNNIHKNKDFDKKINK